MFRVAHDHSGSTTSSGQSPPFYSASPQAEDASGDDDYPDYQPNAKWAMMPVVLLNRCCGLLPVCLRHEPRRFARFSAGLPLLPKSPRWRTQSSAHQGFHILLWVYAVLMTLLCIIAAIAMSVYITTEKINGENEDFVFDLIVLWQSVLLSLCLWVFGIHLKYFLYGVDVFTDCFKYKQFYKQDYFPAGVSINLSDSTYLVNSRNSKPVEVRCAFTQTQDSLTSSQDEGERGYEDPHWTPILSKVRIWNLILGAIAVFCIAGNIAYRIASQDLDPPQPSGIEVDETVPKELADNITSTTMQPENEESNSSNVIVLPLVAVSQWLFIGSRIESVAPEDLATFSLVIGCIVDSIAYTFDVLPQILLCSASLVVIFVIGDFNRKATRAVKSALDIDKVIFCHHKLRRLIHKLNNTFSAVIFVTVVGDSFQVLCGTFLIFPRCDVHNMSVSCNRCIITYTLIAARLIIMLIIAIAVGEEMQNTINIIDDFLTRSILNSDRLKAVSILQWVTNCGLTGCKFFSISRPFAFKFFAFIFALVAIQIRSVMY